MWPCIIYISKEDVPTWCKRFYYDFFSYMASTCFRHLHVHLQEFLYIGCFTAACGWILTDKQCTRIHTNSAGPQPQHLWHNTTSGSETTYIKNSWRWTCKCPKHVEAIYEKKLFASSWYIILTHINYQLDAPIIIYS